MSDVTVQVVDGRVVVAPFGADALVPLVGAANSAKEGAEAAAATSAAYANQPFGEPIPGEPAGNRSALHFAVISSQYADQSRNAAGYETRAELLAAPYAVHGDFSAVFNDPGTHAALAGEYRTNGTVATVGESIPNDGRYTYQASPAAWLRTSNIDSQDAAASVGAVRQVIDFAIQPSAGIVVGAWYAQFFLPVRTTFTSWRAQVFAGSGTVDLYVNVDGVNVYGPRTVGTSADTATPSITIEAGSSVAIQIANITGAPTGVAAQLTGLPA